MGPAALGREVDAADADDGPESILEATFDGCAYFDEDYARLQASQWISRPKERAAGRAFLDQPAVPEPVITGRQ